ncbi:MAG TPA: hypothetical protein VEU62_10230 [Bryobacterales bacterium]|nr:hypothetical protein [Bryobacterales bacterium]
MAASWPVWGPGLLPADDASYFVTYSHQMEELGSLEISLTRTVGKPDGGNRFLNTLMSSSTASAERYLSGQSTSNESTLFTKCRWENRFRPLLRKHWINPVLYVALSNTNGADKSLKEIVGFDGRDDLLEPNAETALQKKRALETKLILSSDFRGWNVSETSSPRKT